MKQRKVLILGGMGMLGHVLLRYLAGSNEYDVYATSRNIAEVPKYFPAMLADKFIKESVDAYDLDSIVRVLSFIRPDVVINCIGIIKQLPMASDPVPAITINSLLPHRIAMACKDAGARMVHISTDCVFDGKKGMYTEDDSPAPEDLYGRSKLLGEVDYPHCVTLRTSIIGHELKGKYGLVEWFLGESGKVKGYKKAIYSGFPTVEFGRVLGDHVLPNSGLNGIYHVSSEPVSKYDLLRLVAERYGKAIEIEPYEGLVLDRSLVSGRFRERTGYTPPSWPEMIEKMHLDYEENRRQYGR